MTRDNEIHSVLEHCDECRSAMDRPEWCMCNECDTEDDLVNQVCCDKQQCFTTTEEFASDVLNVTPQDFEEHKAKVFTRANQRPAYFEELRPAQFRLLSYRKVGDCIQANMRVRWSY